ESSSRSSRSRAVNFRLACCALIRRSPPPSRACSRRSRRCSIFSPVVLAWMPRSVSSAMPHHLVQNVLCYRIGILLASSNRLETRLPFRTRGEHLETALNAVLDNRADLTAGAVGASHVPTAGALQECAMLVEPLHQLRHATTFGCHRLNNWRCPITHAAEL